MEQFVVQEYDNENYCYENKQKYMTTIKNLIKHIINENIKKDIKKMEKKITKDKILNIENYNFYDTVINLKNIDKIYTYKLIV